MKLLRWSTLAAVVLSTPTVVGSQEVAPFFEQARTVSYETYTGVQSEMMDEYFQILVDKYRGTDAPGWGLYRENSKIWYRITPLPNGMQSLIDVQAARNRGSQEFNQRQAELFAQAWHTRQVALYNAAPAMSVVPSDFTVADIQELPYNRVTIYYLDWDKAGDFREALRARSALDREANIDNFVLTAWNGGMGTPNQVVMIRVSAESAMADQGSNRDARRAARTAYNEEFGRLSRVMNEAAYHIERHDQTRIAALSLSPGR
jgi:hypothetical protein